jgi:hypothetical protein
MKFKYRLIENDGEESGLKSFRGKNALFLTGEKGLTADELKKIINDPKNLEGTFAKYSGGLKELKLNVFGDRPNIRATLKANIEIYNNNGKSFYTEIETTTGKKFDKKGAIIKKEKVKGEEIEKTLFVFPQKNIHNEEIVEEYYKITNNEDEKFKKSSLKPTTVDDHTLKFHVGDEAFLKKILTKSGLPKEKYTLKIEKDDLEENLKKLVKEEIKKLVKRNLSTAEKLIKQAEKEGHIKGDYSQMVLDTAKKIAKKWDELNPEEQKVMRDTYYQSFLKKIKK